MRGFLRYLFSFWMYAVKGLLALTIMTNDSVPKIGEGLKISCLTSPVEFIGQLTNTWNYPAKTSATTCFADGHVCTGSTINYGFTADKNGAYVTIYSLDRVRDNGTWTCIGSDNIGTNSTVIIVYTLPTGVALTQDPNTSVDLSVSSVKLQCKTTSCMYPIATVQWFYQDQSNPAAPVFYTTTNSSRTLDSCPNQEQIYISTLDLPHYTTLGDNSDKTVTFSCRIAYLDPSINIMATGQHTIRYAVMVSEVTFAGLGNGVTVLFHEGYIKILQCISSPSRPIAFIRWWLGNRQLSDNITNTGITDSSGLYVLTSQAYITLTRDSTNETIYCDGYNSNQMTPAVSRKYNIDVLYAPDVSVKVNGTTVQNMTLIVLCEARGHPAEYMFHPWKQMWGDKVIRSNLQGTPNSNHNTLQLERLSLQQMGTYICLVDNNVTGSDGKLEQTGSVDVKVTGTPAILKEEEFQFAALVGHSINISIPFYSDPAIESFIFQKNGTGLQNNSRTTMNISSSLIDSKFYGIPVKLEAQMATLFIQNLAHDDFDIYTLVLVNFLGTKEFRFHLYAAVASTSESYGLPVAGIAGGISAGVVIILVVVICIIFWRRYQHTKKNQHENDVTADEERTRRNQIHDVSVKQDVTRGKEYEGLNFTKAEATQYLYLNDISSEENTDPKTRSPESESYEKLHPYINRDIEMYNSLKNPKGCQCRAKIHYNM
ncbi:hypothetical protein ACJMK2_011796 [Sinanodonta woodiana]|uniref:Ig-like domain-containing protein n=1 Tax=Sinanodonta woodiana TaxID=1069815 RepID=A0ABD3V6J5_SINWO